MGRRSNNRPNPSSHSCTLPPSPTHSFSSSSSSSSSSDFEFTISISPRKSSTLLCPADELFYKGQLLPLHLSPRISMVRTLLLSSSSSAAAPRHSTASTTSTSSSFTYDCDSSRPSSVTDDENNFVNRHNTTINNAFHCDKKTATNNNNNNNKYFSFSRFSSVFRKNRVETHESVSVSVSEPSRSVKKMGSTAKEVIRKYLNKVKKPLLFSHKHKDHQQTTQVSSSSSKKVAKRSAMETQNAPPPPPPPSSSFSCLKKETTEINKSALVSSSWHSSFSGNLNYPRRKSIYVSSCPSSMRSSPTHSGVLSTAGGFSYADTSTTEELQNAIQGAIAHCKNSLAQNKDYGAVCFRI
ncbi:probable membrane-associated kinase regulator 1 [Arachis duranensis]|uniref:Probable membrane-associated kinase regulator 1 n=1 Tax=Arachis duranensis TaxID=130453 RepID=A0A6P4C6Q8_ARADU|nr:probable membrane-associated kinase regulator 1 [Arachis duranensis]